MSKCNTNMAGKCDPLSDVLSREMDSGCERRKAQDWAEESRQDAAAAAGSALAAKTSENAAADSARAAAESENAAADSASAAETSKTAAADSAKAAADSADAAQTSAAVAAASKQDAAASASTAAAGAAKAEISAAAAAEQAQTACQYAEAAKGSADAAAEHAARTGRDVQAAQGSAQEAAGAAAAAGTSETNAAKYAKQAQSYAVGGTGTRADEDTDNAAHYYEQAKRISQGLQGALMPMGTISFARLAGTAKEPGYLYNISDAFETDERFKEGPGHKYPAGTNVYYTADEHWDAMSGAYVLGVKGNAEQEYRLGQVNITPAGIGLDKVNNTADADKVVASAGKLTTPRNLKVNLANTGTATFDGSATQENIPVTGIVSSKNGGTGRNNNCRIYAVASTGDIQIRLDSDNPDHTKYDAINFNLWTSTPDIMRFGYKLKGQEDWIVAKLYSDRNKPTPNDIGALPATGKALTSGTADKVANTLTFTGSSTGVFDGSKALTINIPGEATEGSAGLLSPEDKKKIDSIDEKQDKLVGTAGQVVGFDVNGAPQAVELGGTNLITRDFLGSSAVAFDDTNSRSKIGYKTNVGDYVSPTGHYKVLPTANLPFLHKDVTYTVSALVWTAGDNVAFYMDFYPTDDLPDSQKFIATSSPQRFTFTARSDLEEMDQSPSLRFVAIGLNSITESNRLFITDIKLEYGSVATDWSPAPEDLQDKLTLPLSPEQGGTGADNMFKINIVDLADPTRNQFSMNFYRIGEIESDYDFEHVLMQLNTNLNTYDAPKLTIYSQQKGQPNQVGQVIYSTTNKPSPSEIGALPSNGKALTAGTADKVAHALTFTGAVNDTFDGSAAKTISIPEPGGIKIHSAVFTAANWKGDDNSGYTQTVNVAGVTAATELGPPLMRPTGVRDTDEELHEALTIINEGFCEPGSGTVKVTVWEKPETDITVYWRS